jgi:hypothetical protein
MLQQHQRLWVLRLPTIPLGHAAAQHVCWMGGLREVSVCLASGLSTRCLTDLPSSITKIRVNNSSNSAADRNQYDEDDPSDMSEEDADSSWYLSCMRLQQLTGLVDLTLQNVAFAPAELAGATQMQRLVLQDCTLLPRGERDAAEGIGSLLSTLAGYTHLQHLHLCDVGLGENSGYLAPERFAALTASPELTYLQVSGEYRLAPLPSGCVQHMFAVGRSLPLRKLVLLPSFGDHVLSIVNSNAESCCMTGTDLLRLVSSCPELQLLDITGVVHPGDMAMTGLIALPAGCTELCIGGPAVTDAEVRVVRQLTQLRVLRIWDSPGMTDVGMELLTALTSLSALRVRRCDGLSEELGGHHEYFEKSYELRGDEVSVADCTRVLYAGL